MNTFYATAENINSTFRKFIKTHKRKLLRRVLILLIFKPQKLDKMQFKTFRPTLHSVISLLWVQSATHNVLKI